MINQDAIWYLSDANELLRIDKFERFYANWAPATKMHEVIAARPVGMEWEMICIEEFAEPDDAEIFLEWLFKQIGTKNKFSSDDFYREYDEEEK